MNDDTQESSYIASKINVFSLIWWIVWAVVWLVFGLKIFSYGLPHPTDGSLTIFIPLACIPLSQLILQSRIPYSCIISNFSYTTRSLRGKRSIALQDIKSIRTGYVEFVPGSLNNFTCLKIVSKENKIVFLYPGIMTRPTRQLILSKLKVEVPDEYWSESARGIVQIYVPKQAVVINSHSLQ